MAYNYNPYVNNNYYPQYNSGYNQYQPPITQTQTQSQTQDFPFIVVRFGTLDEAKAHIVPPSKAIMFIKSDFSELYVKSADQMGNPSLETIKCTRLNNLSGQVVSKEIDTSQFVKMADLSDFIKKDDLKSLLSKEDGKNFITKDDLKSIDTEIDVLKQQIKLNSLGLEDKKNAK